LLKMSKFFAEGNISDEDSDAGSNENENVGKHVPSYQYVRIKEYRTLWMMIVTIMKSVL
jgi:hypothetical protein